MTARSKPPARAGPFTAATVGSGKRRTVWWNRSLLGHSAACTAGSSDVNSFRSKPAEKVSPGTRDDHRDLTVSSSAS